MEPWIASALTELAKMGPTVGFLGAAVYGLWKRVQDQDKTIAALNETHRQDQKEHSKQLLESSRTMEAVLRQASKAYGRSFSPYPGSTP